MPEAANAAEDHHSAIKSLKEARIREDENLPQCQIVNIEHYSAEVRHLGRAVILRKTPTGMLIVRFFGPVHKYEQRFIWDKYRSVFRQSEKGKSFAANRRELRDVPIEFMPICDEE